MNRPFPLLGHIDIGAELASGEWTLILFRHDCSKCHALMDEYLQETSGNRPARARIALVEIPPFGQLEDDPLVRAGFRTGRLSNSIRWFVTTPVVLRMRDGKVVFCESDDDPRELEDLAWSMKNSTTRKLVPATLAPSTIDMTTMTGKSLPAIRATLALVRVVLTPARQRTRGLTTWLSDREQRIPANIR